MTRLVVHLFGSFQVALDEQPVRAFESDKVRALLAFLVAESATAHRREKLAGLLWPERTERSARTSLRGALADLRRAIGDRDAQPPFLNATRQAVQFNRDADVWVDAVAFGELLKSDALGAFPQELGEDERRRSIHCLEEATGLYRGPFLDGFSVPDAAAFEEWALLERERYQRQTVEALDRLTECYAAQGEYEAALRPAWRQVELDPWNEKGHRNVMRMLVAVGQRGAALAQYEACRALLAEGVGVEPAPATRDLYEKIRSGTLRALYASVPRPPSRTRMGRGPRRLHEQAAPSQVSPPLFLGRERQLERLFGWLNSALSGRVRVAFVIGGPGRGKTALMHAFSRQAMERHPGLVVVGGHCNAYAGVGDPYLPFQMILGQLAGDVHARWAAGTISREHAFRLWRALPLTMQAIIDHGPDLVDTFVRGDDLLSRAVAFGNDEGTDVSWLAELRALVERKHVLPPEANLRQSALFSQYGRVLRVVAQQYPLLLLIDDLQWTDLGSASLLLDLGRGLSENPIFVLGAYRSEEVAASRLAAAYDGLEAHPLQNVLSEMKRLFGDAWIDLSRTDAAEDRRFADALLDSQPNRLDDVFRTTFYQHTQGHPLFSLELLRAMRERGDLAQDTDGRWIAQPTLDWRTLPPQVEGVIEQRVSRVGAELREILDIASVEGEDFTAQVIARVLGVDEQDVVHKLSADLEARHRLVVVQGLSRLGDQTLSQHRFCHNLYQKYLYQNLNPGERSYRHRDVGAALEDLYQHHPGTLAAAAPQLARHYREAGVIDKAVQYLQMAGERATSMSANQEAVVHFTQALELLAMLPDTPERAEQELISVVGLLIPLQVIEGYGTPRMAGLLARARELCETVEETPSLFQVLFVLQSFHAVRAEYSMAHEVGEQLLKLGERSGDSTLVLIAHADLAYPLIMCGELTRGLAHAQHALDLYDPDLHQYLAYQLGVDPGVTCRVWASLALCLLGYPDQALKFSREALDLAQQRAHSASQAFAQTLGGGHLCHFYRDLSRCRMWAERSIALCSREGFPLYLAKGYWLRGWALAEQGRAVEGMAQIREGIRIQEGTGSLIGMPLMLMALARAYGLAEMPDEGLAQLAKAKAIQEETGERMCEAEMHRLNGELLKMQGAPESEVESYFWRAIAVARGQSAKCWELRATMSLARLWQEQGKVAPAHALLGEIYGWFTEGFDGPDLQDAKALLEEMS